MGNPSAGATKMRSAQSEAMRPGGAMSVRTVGDVFHSIALLPKRETACGQDSVKKMLAARRRLRYSNSCAETRT